MMDAEASSFRVLCKGMAMTSSQGGEVVVALAAVVCGVGPQGGSSSVLKKHKRVLIRQEEDVGGGGGGEVVAEAMALVLGLQTALRMGVSTVQLNTHHKLLHDHMVGILPPPTIDEKLLADNINEALSVQKQFKQCEISLVDQTQVRYVAKLARKALDAKIDKSIADGRAMEDTEEETETCIICLEYKDVAKIHAVEGCTHRFCFSCLERHVRFQLLNGRLPSCRHICCITRLTVEGSKPFLPMPLLEIMEQRVMEAQIPPSQRIYCPYPKCSALMSSSLNQLALVVVQGTTTSKSKCVSCGGLLCVRCKVAWHEGMSCSEYKRRYPHGTSQEDAQLHKFAKKRMWQQRERCNHMIELATGCQHIFCRCGHEFCYLCGKGWNFEEGRPGCYCPMVQGADRNRRWLFPLLACLGRMRRR